jgi:MoaA/NifB/PqqE/SkfB family radical SAM enzyme
MKEQARSNPNPIETKPRLPGQCYIEVSTRCNLECIFCIRPHIPSRVKDDMSLAEFAAILGNLGLGEGFNPIVIVLGMGEPFMNRSFIPMLQYAKRHYPSVPLSFFTNFSLPKPEDIAALVEIGVDEVIVSIECFEPDAYRKFRRGGEYERVRRNIELLGEAKSLRQSCKPACSMGFVLTRDTVPHMANAVEFAIRNGMYRVYFMCCYYLSNDAESLMDFESSRFREAFSKAVQIGERAGVGVQFTGPRAYEYDRCSIPFDVTYIAVDGTVFPCCITMIDPKLHHWAMGNLTKEAFDRIWHSDKLSDIRRLIYSGGGLCGFCPIYFDRYKNVIVDLDFLKPTS